MIPSAVQFSFDEVTESLIPSDEMGAGLLRQDVEDIIRGLRNYLKNALPDSTIERINHKIWNYHANEPKEPKTRPGFIYLIKCEQSGAYKIGFSIKPDQRLRGLIRTTATPLVLVHTIPVTNMYPAERFLHRKFKEKRLHSEWFSLDSKDVDWICSLTEVESPRQIAKIGVSQ